METLDRTAIQAATDSIGPASAREAIRWAWETFAERCCLLSSMQDAVLIDLTMQVAPGMPVVFLDNGFHFPSTLETLRRVEERYAIDVQIVSNPAQDSTSIVPGECCDRKAALLVRALGNRDAWLSGIQREQTLARSTASFVDLDRRGKVKISPLAQWSHGDRERYIAAHDVIVHPLVEQGYTSIGCSPCTVPAGDDPRSGRWADSERTECGLHL